MTLKQKAKEVEETRLTAEAQKARQVQEAEAAAAQRVIAARAEADAMKHVLALKEKQIQQKKLEAEAERQSIVQRAQAAAEASRIQSQADADRRKDDGGRRGLRHPRDRRSRSSRASSGKPSSSPPTRSSSRRRSPTASPTRVQVILTPSIGGEAFTGEVFKRVVNGQPAVDPAAGGCRPPTDRRKAPTAVTARPETGTPS